MKHYSRRAQDCIYVKWEYIVYHHAYANCVLYKKKLDSHCHFTEKIADGRRHFSYSATHIHKHIYHMIRIS